MNALPTRPKANRYAMSSGRTGPIARLALAADKWFVRFVVLGAALLIPGSLFAGDDVQFWLEGSLVAEATEHVRVKVDGTTKLREDGSFFYEAKEIGVIYTGISQWLDLGLYYKTIFQQDDSPGQENVWQHENRPHVNATARFDLFGFAFSDRIQVEYNHLEDP